jgi:hypothetical protein
MKKTTIATDSPSRKAAEQTVDATWRRIGALVQAFSAAECANAGYTSE